jgi:peptidoglycan/LPS O-acetylase OafA/YrhL
MQLFILAPLLLYPVWRWGQKWAGVLVVLIVASILCNFFVVYDRQFRMSFFENDDQTNLYYQKIVYLPTHMRMGPYLVGLLLGLTMHAYKGQEVVINKVVVTVVWVITLATLMAVVFGPYPVHRPQLNETVLQSALYHSLSRVAWSIAIAWLIFACTHGYGGLIHWLLAHPMWQPLARLSFCIYVLHLPIQIVLLASEKQSIYLSDIRMAHKFWGDFGFAMLLATVWSLAFEMPVPLLENYGRTIVVRVRPNKGISMTSLVKYSVTDVTASNANCSHVNDRLNGVVVVAGKAE